MSKKSIQSKIDRFVAHTKRTLPTCGVLMCGSFARGDYDPQTSDIDILFLSKDMPFRMELQLFENVIFDKLVADPDMLIDVLSNLSEVSKILSHSFGSEHRIIEHSDALVRLLELASENIKAGDFRVEKTIIKQPKTVDGSIYTMQKVNGIYRLLKNDEVFL